MLARSTLSVVPRHHFLFRLKSRILLDKRYYVGERPSPLDLRSVKKMAGRAVGGRLVSRERDCEGCESEDADEIKRSVAVCRDCFAHLCRDCVDKHLRSGTTRDHEVVATAIRQSAERPSRVLLHCKHCHNQLLVDCPHSLSRPVWHGDGSSQQAVQGVSCPPMAITGGVAGAEGGVVVLAPLSEAEQMEREARREALEKRKQELMAEKLQQLEDIRFKLHAAIDSKADELRRQAQAKVMAHVEEANKSLATLHSFIENNQNLQARADAMLNAPDDDPPDEDEMREVIRGLNQPLPEINPSVLRGISRESLQVSLAEAVRDEVSGTIDTMGIPIEFVLGLEPKKKPAGEQGEAGTDQGEGQASGGSASEVGARTDSPGESQTSSSSTFTDYEDGVSEGSTDGAEAKQESTNEVEASRELTNGAEVGHKPADEEAFGSDPDDQGQASRNSTNEDKARFDLGALAADEGEDQDEVAKNA